MSTQTTWWWKDGNEMINHMLLQSAPEGLQGAGQAFSFRLLMPQVFCWVLLMLGLFTFTQVALRKRLCSLRDDVQEKVIFYMLELVTCTLLLCSMIFSGALSVAWNDDLLSRDRVDTFSDELGWVENMNRMSVVVGFGIIPILALYMVELARMGGSNLDLLIHHLFSLVLVIVGVAAASETLDLRYFTIGLVFLLHAALEQPCFTALIMFRLCKNRQLTAHALLAAALYTLILRVTLNTLCFYLWGTFTFQTYVHSSWSLFWSILFFVMLLPVTFVQLRVAKVFLLLHYRCKKEISKANAKNKSVFVDQNGSTLDDANSRPELGEGATDLELGDAEDSTSMMQTSQSSLASRASQGHNNNSNGEDSTKSPRRKDNRNSPLVSGSIMCIVAVGLATLFLTLPFNTSTVMVTQRQRVAIIGGGVSGLAAAWSLSQSPDNFDVTIFEREESLGGAVTTFYTDQTSREPSFLDLGFRTFNNFALFDNLLEMLGQDKMLRQTGANIIVKSPGNHTTIVGPGLPKNMSVANSKLHNEILRFREALNDAIRSYSEERLMTESVQDLVEQSGLSSPLLLKHLKACLSLNVAVGAAGFNTSLGVMYFMERRFPVCTSLTRATSEYIVGGADSYVKAFEARLRKANVDIKLNTNVERIAPRQHALYGGKAIVRDAVGIDHQFDHVILTNPTQMARLISPPENDNQDLARVVRLLSLAKHQSTATIVSNDTSLMGSLLQSPDDSCFYLESQNLVQQKGQGQFLSLSAKTSLHSEQCLKSHPVPFSVYGEEKELLDALKPNTEITKKSFKNILHDSDFLVVGRNLHKYQGRYGLWFAGGDCTVNLHETALASGLVIAQQLGAPTTPFIREDTEALNSFLAVKLLMLHGLNTLFIPH